MLQEILEELFEFAEKSIPSEKILEAQQLAREWMEKH